MSVGLCLERSPEWMVGMLGILKAGGAYAPLDPAQPKQRAAQMLEDLQANVLFIAGSTGCPKGVAVEHRQLLNYLHGINARLRLPEDAGYATVSTFAADLGNTAIFPAPAGGGTLHIVTQARATDPEAFAEYVQHHAIDCLKIVPSHPAALLEAPKPERVLPQRRLVIGGEAAPAGLPARVRQLQPHCEIIN